MNGLQPQMQLDLAALKNRADRYRKLLTAISALPQTRSMRFASKSEVFAYTSAMRAYRAMRPAQSLKIFTRFIFVLELRLIQYRFSHDCISMYG
jgi:hypothetical protein